jgi:mRNA interferase RelE/StbE
VKTIFRSSFLRDVKTLRDKQLSARVMQTIQQVEQADSLASLSNVKQLRGEKGHYRIRIGEYRLGLTIQDDTATFVRLLHRREIYRYFP